MPPAAEGAAVVGLSEYEQEIPACEMLKDALPTLIEPERGIPLLDATV